MHVRYILHVDNFDNFVPRLADGFLYKWKSSIFCRRQKIMKAEFDLAPRESW